VARKRFIGKLGSLMIQLRRAWPRKWSIGRIQRSSWGSLGEMGN
jgi:hypothetical protein